MRRLCHAVVLITTVYLVPSGAAFGQTLPLAERVAGRTTRERANLDLLERYHRAVWVDKQTHQIPVFMSAGFMSHAAPDAPPGPEAVRGFLDQLFSALPDLRSQTLFDLVDGDTVVTAWTITGTHTGTALFGVSATGRAVRVSGFDVLRIDNDRFVEHWFGLGQVMPELMLQLRPAPPGRGARP